MRSYCPLGRQSCIGRYRRNVLTLKQTMAWVLLWCVSGIVDICLQALFIFYKEEWSSETIFWIWNIKGAAWNEVFHILIPFALSVPTDVISDEDSENSSGVDVYPFPVPRGPLVPRRPLMPRRPCENAFWKSPERIFVQAAPTKKKKKEGYSDPLKEICPKESYKDKVLARNELPLIDPQNKEIILSIPNLHEKNAFPCILYCKVHQSYRIVS